MGHKEEIHDFLDKYGYAVVMMHPYEFAESELGVYTGEPNMKEIGERYRTKLW